MAIIIGTDADDTLGNGMSTEENTITALAGMDLVFGGLLADIIYGGADADTVNGGLGDDAIFGASFVFGFTMPTGGLGTAASPYFYNSVDFDALEVDNDILNGGAGRDTIYGGYGDDIINGGDGDDSGSTTAIFGNIEVYVLRGLFGNVGEDQINGGAGSDSIYGGEGADILHGDDGNDVLEGGDGSDNLNGGAGLDWVSYRFATTGIAFSMDNSLASTGDAVGDIIAGVENLQGSLFDDALSGDHLSNKISGLDGNDIIYGRAGNDAIYSGSGDDTVYGGEGDDLFYLATGADLVYGGIGTDTATFEKLDLYDPEDLDPYQLGVIVRLHDQTQNARAALNVRLSSIEKLIGSKYIDELYGDYRSNFIDGGDGDDTINGGGGNDILIGGKGADWLDGGVGNDLLLVNNGDSLLEGGDGLDTLRFLAPTKGVVLEDRTSTNNIPFDISKIFLIGVEVIESTKFSDRIYAGIEDNYINSFNGNDLVYGYDGNDIILGGVGNDRLYGQVGDDQILGDSGNDVLNGNSGNDWLWGGTGRDILNGADGSDGASYFYASASVHIALDRSHTQKGEAVGDILYNVENLEGSKFADKLTGNDRSNTIYGSAGGDSIFGNSGDDLLLGEVGNDRLYGGEGYDELTGGLGKDYLYGGNGYDTFAYWASAEGGDKIAGFSSRDAFAFKGTAFGFMKKNAYLNSSAFHTNTTGNAHDSSDRFIYETDSDRLWFDADGTGAKAKILIADIATNATVTSGDIWIF